MSGADSWFAPKATASLETIRRVRDEPPPTPSVAGWLYPASTATIFGEPDAGKSMLAAATAQRVVHDGGQVLWLDYEMGERRVIERLLAFGLTDVELAENVYRLHSPSGLPPASFAEAFAGVTLAVVDSFTGPLSAFGGSSNTDTDIETVYASLLRPLAAAGSSVLVLDHVVKKKEEQGRWAVGSQRKLGAPDLAYSFHPVQRFRPGMGGRARLRMARDRAGGIEVIDFALEPDMAWRLSNGASGADGFRPTGYMERVSIYLEGQREASSGAELEANVKGGSDHLRKAAEVLAAEGYISIETGPRGALLHTSIRPYREADDPHLATSPDLATSSPRRGDNSTSPPRRPLRSRDEVAGSNPLTFELENLATSPDPDEAWLADLDATESARAAEAS